MSTSSIDEAVATRPGVNNAAGATTATTTADAAISASKQARRRHGMLVSRYRELKTNRPCADCRGRFHHAAMTCDHLPGTEKVSEVSTPAYHSHSRASVLAEIAKCELVCANCHAVRSFERARGVAQPG
jgi:hypothetical protein